MPDEPPPPPPGAPPGWTPGPPPNWTTPPGAPPGWTPGPPPNWTTPPGAPPGWTPGPPPGWSYAPPPAPPPTAPPGAPPGWTPGPGPQAPPSWTGSGGSSPYDRPGRLPVRPHPVFFAMCAGMVVCGYLAARGVGSPRVWVFGFVALGWVISLCLHEFAHAAVAWIGGDHSVEGRGYLTLNPARYMNSQMSIVLPVLIVLIGGIALPGGAVMVDRRFIRERHMQSLVSAAGPFTNLVCALACGLPIAFGLVHVSADSLVSLGRVGAFPAALAFLALLEVIATILNLLPIPGFDGFGVIAPYLPDETVRSLMPISRYAWFGLFFVLFYSAGGRAAFWNVAYHAASLIGVPIGQAINGQFLFTFWRKLS